MKLLIPLLFIALALAGCSKQKSEDRAQQEELLGYTLQRTWPHDVKAFTQGLVIHEGQLYESTGESDS